MRHELSWNSWLFSRPYTVAMGFAILEYSVEALLVPGLKVGTGGMGYLPWLGVVLIVLGEGIRKVGMLIESCFADS
ncbi:hypothetical protein CHLRE_01g018184v5 [Chlamydomonas reinhardtii]|uniref:Uncharacterized protein n=1 Tax=Chlamydomonas reinhardtii TaxID=3055 RepID=A0A2K3E5W1_CHLRE|nr:uncharacterized protein CHLRE_01g018184v5 [Chlamydomonas reinhardtii]PNW88189.1 hypothetical protein CHLRE_01g018184v5 [Chlamydomonas reinhardtii]